MVPQPFVISVASCAIWIACRRQPDSEVVVHYLLFYEAATNYEERRKPFRSAHLQHAQAAVARGELVLGGAFANPIDGAVLLFRARVASRRGRVCEERSLRGEWHRQTLVRARVDDRGRVTQTEIRTRIQLRSDQSRFLVSDSPYRDAPGTPARRHRRDDCHRLGVDHRYVA